MMHARCALFDCCICNCCCRCLCSYPSSLNFVNPFKIIRHRCIPVAERAFFGGNVGCSSVVVVVVAVVEVVVVVADVFNVVLVCFVATAGLAVVVDVVDAVDVAGLAAAAVAVFGDGEMIFEPAGTYEREREREKSMMNDKQNNS